MFENIREDWITYEKDLARQGLWVMVVYRFGRWRYGVRPPFLRQLFSLLYRFLKVFSQILTGVEIPCETIVGRRFRIDHFGGIVISGDTVIGDDVIVRNGVTLGLRRTGVVGAPIIGNRVDIGAGAKFLVPSISETMLRSEPMPSCSPTFPLIQLRLVCRQPFAHAKELRSNRWQSNKWLRFLPIKSWSFRYVHHFHKSQKQKGRAGPGPRRDDLASYSDRASASTAP